MKGRETPRAPAPPLPVATPMDEPTLATLTAPVPVRRFQAEAALNAPREDWVAIEAPLVLEAALDGERARVTTTMRTPGHDAELALGFLWAEGVVETAEDVASVALEAGVHPEAADRVLVTLAAGARARLRQVTRRTLTTSACGVCGRDDVDELLEGVVKTAGARAPSTASAAMLRALPQRLRAAQRAFARTGGLHAAALFEGRGEQMRVREDVGRHNALDKLLGSMLRDGTRPGEDDVLLVSGRASYELVQKAAVAGVRIMAAVGAPSSLAIRVAAAADLTLVGFLREEGFNLYHQSQGLTWSARA